MPDLAVPSIVLLAGALAGSAAWAQPGFFESEPNDIPADANAVAGPVAIYGAMPPGDQDGFLLTVSDDDARKLWDFELTGIPGALTIADLLRVKYADNGRDVEAVEPLMKMGTRDGLTPSIHRNQLLEPGEYIVGIAHVGGDEPEQGGGMFRPPVSSLSFGEADDTGTGADASNQAAAEQSPDSQAYRFVISEGRALNVSPTPAPHATQADALDIRPGYGFATFDSEKSAWYGFTFDENMALQRWDIEIRAPIGRELTARLLDSDGAELERSSVDPHGSILFADLAPGPTTWYLELTTPEPGFIHAVNTEAVG